MNRIAHPLFACALALSLTAPGFAQDLDEVQKRLDRDTQRQEKALAAAAASAENAPGGDRIRWEEVYKNPDDIELNYRYAQQQVAEGDVRGAVATLERILIVDPALPRVRLFYAVVLYRLGSYAESRRELLMLKDLQMPDSLRAEIDEYLRRIQRKLRRTNISARLAVGFQYDTNRNAAPASGQRLFGGTPVNLISGLKEGDQAIISMAHIAAVHDLGTQAGHTLEADYGFYKAEQAELDLQDFDAHSWNIGGTWRTATAGAFTPKAVFQFYQLDNLDYMRGRGFQFGWQKTLSTRWSLDTGLRTVQEEFIPRAVANADQRTGPRTQWWLGGQFAAHPRHRLGLRYTLDAKEARKHWNAYTRHSFMGNHQWLLGAGRFLLSTLIINKDDYKGPEALISRRIRKDASSRVNLTYGQPLGGLSSFLRDFIWTLSYEFYSNSSNITNYAYSNHKGNMMFTYKWDY